MAVTSRFEQTRNIRAQRRATEYLAKALGAIGVGGKAGLNDVGVEVTNRVKDLLSQPGQGRVYRRGGVLHRASAPGAPPAVDTGRLRASYTWRTGEDVQGSYVEVGTNVEYAPHLEFGTRRMRPRPHLRVAINELRADIGRLVRDGIIEEQRGVVRRMPREVGAE